MASEQGAADRRYHVRVHVRWSDLDAFGHVNNARTVTLLEEARVDWLFVAAGEKAGARLTEGIVVAHLDIDYLRPIPFGLPVDISMGVSALGSASFTVDYQVRAGDILVATASTVLVPVDLVTGRPRRLEARERAYLSGFQDPEQVSA